MADPVRPELRWWRTRGLEAFCLCVVTTDQSPTALLENMKLSPLSEGVATLEDSWPSPSATSRERALAGREGHQLIFLGMAGSSLAFPPVTTRMAHHSDFASCYQSVNGDMRLVVARAGSIIRDFDPFLEPPAGSVDLMEEAGLESEFDSGSPAAASIELIARLTGVVLDEHWCDVSHDLVSFDPGLA